MRYDAGLYCAETGVVSTTRASVRSVTRIGLTALLVAGLVVVTLIPGAEADGGQVEAVSHVIKAGDSLWSVAVAHTPETGDVRHTVDLIRDANRMSSDVVHVGDAIEVPVGDIPGWSLRRR